MRGDRYIVTCGWNLSDWMNNRLRFELLNVKSCRTIRTLFERQGSAEKCTALNKHAKLYDRLHLAFVVSNSVHCNAIGVCSTKY